MTGALEGDPSVFVGGPDAPWGTVVLGRTGEAILVDEVAASILGLPADAVLGTDAYSTPLVVVGLDGTAIAMGDRAEIRVLTDGRPRETLTGVVTAAGTRWFLTWIEAVQDDETPDALLRLTIRDLTPHWEATGPATAQAGFAVAFDPGHDLVGVWRAGAGMDILLGPAAPALLGIPAGTIELTALAARMHPDEHQMITAEAVARLAAGEIVAITHRLRHEDGTWRWFDTRMRGVVNPATGDLVEVAAIGRDVQERAAAEQRQRLADARWRTAFDLGPVGQSLVRADGTIAASNRAAQAHWGRDPDTLLVTRVRREHQPDVAAALARVAEGTGASAELDVQAAMEPTADSTRWTWLHLSMAPLPGAEEDDPLVLVQAIDVDAEMEAHESIASTLLVDPLTGAGSRLAALRAVRAALENPAADDATIAVAIADLDGFAALNAALGTEVGDQVLVEVARRLACDVPAVGFVGRWAGDEFLVLLHAWDVATGEAGAEVQRAVARPMEIDGTRLVVTARVGVAIAPAGSAARWLVQDAEAALREARRHRDDHVRAAQPGAARSHAALFEATELVRAALAEGRVVAHFQPVCAADDLAVAGWESLVRIRRPDGGYAAPAEFLAAAEASGLMVPLGDEMLRQAIAHVAAWRDLPEPPPVSLNLSARELREPALHGRIHDALAQSALPTSSLIVEVTEELLSELDDRGLALLGSLRDEGVAVALDDFGSGFSALARLVDLPLTFLKLDASFLASRAREPRRSVAVMHAVVELAHDLGLRVCAEGVETAEELGLVRGLGVDFVQGFLLGRPVPSAACGPWPRTAVPDPGSVRSRP